MARWVRLLLLHNDTPSSVLALTCTRNLRQGGRGDVIKLDNARIDIDVFRALLRWMYTERLEVRMHLCGITSKLARQCGLADLHARLQEEMCERGEGQNGGNELVVVEPPAADAKLRLQGSFGARLRPQDARFSPLRVLEPPPP